MTNTTYVKFMGADANHDGRLDLDEFVPFIHPLDMIDDHMMNSSVSDTPTMIRV